MPDPYAAAAERVLRELTPGQRADYERALGGPERLAAAMAERSAKLRDFLAGAYEPVGDDDPELLAAATLTVGNNGAGVHRENRYAAESLRKLRELRRDLPRVPLSVLIMAGSEPYEVLARMRLCRETEPLMTRPDPLFDDLATRLLIIAATPLRPDPASIAALAGDLIRWAVDGVRAYRAERPETLRRALPVPGNVLFFLDVAAAAIGLDHVRAHGTVPLDPLGPDALDRALSRLITLARGYYGRSYDAYGEPDGSVVPVACAEFLGGDGTKRIYELLDRDLAGPRVRPGRDVPVDLGGRDGGTEEAAYAEDDAGARTRELIVDRLVAWLMAELFADADAKEAAHTGRWLAAADGFRPSGTYVLALVDRLRAVDDRFRALPRSGPAPESPMWPGADAVRDVLTARLRAAMDELETGELGDEAFRAALAAAALPPLWPDHRRRPLIDALASRIRVTRGHGPPEHAALVAAIMVRAPHQEFWARTSADAGPCACGARTPAGRPDHAAPAHAVCPHRAWRQPGPVENYTTLTRVSERGLGHPMTTEAVRKALRRYTGPLANRLRSG